VHHRPSVLRGTSTGTPGEAVVGGGEPVGADVVLVLVKGDEESVATLLA